MHGIVSYIKTSDVELFFIFNQRLHCAILDIVMRLVTQLGSLLFSIIIPIIMIASARYEMVATGIKISAVLALSQLMVHFIKRIVNRPRPYEAMNNVIAQWPTACVYSFPSGHTCAAFSLALVLSNSYPLSAPLILFLAGLVGISRMYLGVHYPTDVIVGFLIAYGSYSLVQWLMLVSMFI